MCMDLDEVLNRIINYFELFSSEHGLKFRYELVFEYPAMLCTFDYIAGGIRYQTEINMSDPVLLIDPVLMAKCVTQSLMMKMLINIKGE